MNVKTDRLLIQLASNTELQEIIDNETNEELKIAYMEMQSYSKANPEMKKWYAPWIIRLSNGIRIGDIGFKGLNDDGIVEVGYGLLEEYWGKGYTTEALREIVKWALLQDGVKQIEAETDINNKASQRVLEKVGFLPLGIYGEEGPRFYFDGSIIRLETINDYKTVENMVRESFWNVYRPGCMEHYVLHKIRDDKDFVKELDFVIEKDGKIIGQNIFVKTVIDSLDGKRIDVLTMGPICIDPNFKRMGYGRKLLNYSLNKAKQLGYCAVLIEGNINFYGKCGFDYARKYGIKYPGLIESVDDSFFLCNELIKGSLNNIKGTYKIPLGYLVDEVDVDEFDKNFKYKEKKKLPGQLVK